MVSKPRKRRAVISDDSDSDREHFIRLKVKNELCKRQLLEVLCMCFLTCHLTADS